MFLHRWLLVADRQRGTPDLGMLRGGSG